MACNLTTGFALDCRDNVGGINKIHIGNFDGSAAVGFTGSGEITDATGTFYTYDMPMGNATFSETAATSRQNGTIFYEPTVTVKLHKMCVNLRNELKLLGHARTVIIVELNMLDGAGNNIALVVGKENGMMLDASNAQSGTAFGDYVGQELTFKGMEQDPYHVVDTGVSSLSSATFSAGTFGSC